MTLRNLFLFASLAIYVSFAWADAGSVTVHNAWVRATVPGQEVAGAYMEITSTKEARLIKVETTVAKMAEIHSMKMENGIMRMQALQGLPLPAKQTVHLAPGGYHLMLMGIQQQLKAGDTVPITLTVESAGQKRSVVTVQAPVRQIN